ncbi:unnamed protein product, partial [Musa textilis]
MSQSHTVPQAKNPHPLMPWDDSYWFGICLVAGHSNLYPPSQSEYGYPYQTPPSRPGVYPPPPPPQGYQGYFTDEYPPPLPPPPSQPYYQAYDDDDGSCLSFLQGCCLYICLKFKLFDVLRLMNAKSYAHSHCCSLLLLSAGEMLLLKTGLVLKFVPPCLEIRSVVLQVPANFSSFSVFIVYSLHGTHPW